MLELYCVNKVQSKQKTGNNAGLVLNDLYAKSLEN